MLKKLLLLCLAVLSSSALVRGQDSIEPGSRYAIIIGGIGGQQEFTDKYFVQTSRMYDILIDTLKYHRDNVFYLFEDVSFDPERIQNVSSAENIRQLFGDLSRKLKSEDQLFVFMVGHGTFDGDWSKFNLPGPDLRDIDFARMLNNLPTNKIVLVNSASASGPFIEHLSAEGRVIITATKSGQQYHETSFADFFLDALTDAAADKNKDNRISILEAFEFARSEQDAWYDEQRRLRAEHPVLDDNGDGSGSQDLQQGDDGLWASRVFIAPVSPELRSSIERLQAGNLSALDSLRLEKVKLEEQIANLKARKPQMDEKEYARQLEIFLVDLARLNRRIRELE